MSTVWVNGCFDILHPGHIELFKVAKSLGDKLIVGVDTDEKVKQDISTGVDYNNYANICTAISNGAPVLSSGRSMQKPDNGFRDVLKQIKKNNIHSDINTFK